MHQNNSLNNFTVLVWSSGEEESSSDEDDVGNDPDRSEPHTPAVTNTDAAVVIQRALRSFLYKIRSDHDAEELVCAARLQIDSQMDERKAESVAAIVLAAVEDSGALPNNLIIVDEGKEPPQFSASKAYLFNTQFSQVRFFGRCFLCGCPGHSQRYCALKYCAHCDSYGHSMVCCGRQNFQIQIQRKKSFQRLVRRVNHNRQSKPTKRTKPTQQQQQQQQQQHQHPNKHK